MIIKQYNSYLGLDQLVVPVLDTNPTSPNYLRIDAFPTQLTAGRNAFKLYGNPAVFKLNSPLLVEVLDSAGNTVYQFMPDYYDSLKRRTIIIQVDENTAPGPGLITICSVLRDELVDSRWWGSFNFKWQAQINIAPFVPNETEIIYLTPPKIEFNTRVKPFVTASRRNDLEMISYEYGDYHFYDYNFEDHIGDADSSETIFQNNKADTLLGSYVDPSITAFDRDNVFYLKEENFSAKHVVKNYSILHPGKSFYAALGNNLVVNGNFTSSLDYWVTGSDLVNINLQTSYPGNQSVFTGTGTTSYIRQEITNLKAGQYYLLTISNDRSIDPYAVSLGVNSNNNLGSIYVNSYATASYVVGVGFADDAFILQASDAGNNLLISSSGIGSNTVANVRLYEIQSIEAPDFSLNSDLIGGYIKIKNPAVYPQIESGFKIENDDPSYASYIDQVFQKHDAGVDDRFNYTIVKQDEVNNPGRSYNTKKHRVSVFDSTTILDNQIILPNVQYAYNTEISVDLFPYVNNCLNPTLYNNKFYGTFGFGGRFSPHGAIYEYDPILKSFKILYNFDGQGGSYPQGSLLPAVDPTTGRVVFYGSTITGGKFNSGSLYSYTPSTNAYRLLYNFGQSGSQFNAVNRLGGVQGGSALTLASDGSIYGTTYYGGDFESGVIFKYNLTTGTYDKLYSVPGMFAPVGLVENGDYLWGVAPFGGINTSGSIFKYGITGSTFTTVHSFDGTDGQQPDGMFLVASDGALYGTTITSSISGEGAVLYKVDPATDTFTDLVHFDSVTTGSYGSAKLFETDGKLYGLCRNGGTYDSGSIFVYDSASNAIQVLHYFGSGSDGSQPAGSMTRLGNSIYGATRFGGDVGAGTMFRFDLISPSAPFVKIEGGSILHNNAILPTRVPSYATLIEDYPAWTGPISFDGGTGLYALVELKLKELTPLTGDVSKIRIAAKPKGTKSEYVDLGVYSTKPTDVLMDTNYVNHVQYAYSPYRLTGYFKPVITDYNTSVAENPANKDTLFLNGWSSGSVTNSYFNLTDFHNNIEIIGSPAAGKPVGSIARMKVTSSLSGNGMAYMILTSSALPPIGSDLNTWQQISYELYSAYPILNGMEISSSNYYTASSAVDYIGLNNLLVYSALFTNTASITNNDIYAVSPVINYNKFNITGSSPSSSAGDHPFVFHNKLGWKTDDYLIPNTIAASSSVYMGLIFEYNSSSLNLFDTTVDSNNPHILDVANVISREVGDREYMINTYWDWYARAKYPNTTLVCTASVESNTDILMDSAYIHVIDNPYSGIVERNTVVFQTKDSYEFSAGVPYIISFNAVSKINEVPFIGAEAIDNKFLYPLNDVNPPTWTALPTPSWNSSSGNWVSFTFDTQISGTLVPPTGSNPNPSANTYYNGAGVFTYGAGSYIFKINTGEFTYSTLNNPTTLKLEWPAGSMYSIPDVKPFTSYSLTVPMPAETTNVPKIILESSYTDPSHTAYLLEASIRPYQVAYDANSYTGYEFVNSYGTNNLAGFTGTLLFGVGSAIPGTKLTSTEGGVGYDRMYYPHSIDNPPVVTTNVLVTYRVETGQWQNTDPTSIIAITVNNAATEIGRITNPQPNTVYTGQAIIPTLNTAQQHGPDILLFSTTAGRVNEIIGYRITADPVYAFISKANPILPASSSLSVYGLNGPIYGTPFRDQITTSDIGEFIGELIHKNEYGISGETKNFGRIEMEFEVESDGYGKIGFETEAGSNWYLSEISVRPKDRVGLTPGYSRTFIRVPAALVNKPLTLKMEYLNDFNIKSPYVTVLNDIIFSNYEDTVAIPNMTQPTSNSGGSVTPPPPPTSMATNRYNLTGGSAFASRVGPTTPSTDTDTQLATFSSVIVNTPNVTLVSSDKIKFNVAGTYTIAYSLTTTTSLSEIGATADARGNINLRRFSSTNVLISTIDSIIVNVGDPATNTLSGTVSVTVNADDYISLQLIAYAEVGIGTAHEADSGITADSGYIEVTI